MKKILPLAVMVAALMMAVGCQKSGSTENMTQPQVSTNAP